MKALTDAELNCKAESREVVPNSEVVEPGAADRSASEKTSIVEGNFAADFSQRLREIATIAESNQGKAFRELDLFNEQRKAGAGFESMSAEGLLGHYLEYREVMVEGVIRKGETCNIIAAPKIGKSWLVLLLALAVVTGGKWLGRKCKKTNVLLVDGELHPETLAVRIKAVAIPMKADLSGLSISARRGMANGLDEIKYQLIEQARALDAGLIILDALYRFWPKGYSENDNAQVTEIYNMLDEIARESGAAIVVVHHSSKGNQSEKSTTDGGSGAGAISRAADTHIFLRPHETEGRIVFNAVTRSFPQPDSMVIYRDEETGLWRTDSEADPTRLAGKSPANKYQEIAEVELVSFLQVTHEPKNVIHARIEGAGHKISLSKLKGRLDLLCNDGKAFSSNGERGAKLYGSQPANDVDTASRIAEACKKMPKASVAAIAEEAGCTGRAVYQWRKKTN